MRVGQVGPAPCGHLCSLRHASASLSLLKSSASSLQRVSLQMSVRDGLGRRWIRRSARILGDMPSMTQLVCRIPSHFSADCQWYGTLCRRLRASPRLRRLELGGIIHHIGGLYRLLPPQAEAAWHRVPRFESLRLECGPVTELAAFLRLVCLLARHTERIDIYLINGQGYGQQWETDRFEPMLSILHDLPNVNAVCVF